MGARCARFCRRRKQEDNLSLGSEESDPHGSEEKAPKKRCFGLCCCCRCLQRGRKDEHVRTRTWDDDFRLACALGKASTVQRLRDSIPEEDFEVDCETQHGYCGIHAAALHGHVPVIELLIEWQSDMNKKTEAGMTPLHYAASNGHSQAVEELLLAGADQQHQTQSVNKEHQRTAEDMADQFDYEDILQLFQDYKREGSQSVNSDLRDAGNPTKKMKKSRSGISGKSKSSRGSSRSGSSSRSSQSRSTDQTGNSKNTSKKEITHLGRSGTLASATSNVSAPSKASFQDVKKKIQNSMTESPRGTASASGTSASSKTSKSTASSRSRA